MRQRFLLVMAMLASCGGVSAHLQRAQQLEDEQLYQEALAELEAAEKMEPENPEPKIRKQRLQSKLAAQAASDGAALLEMKDAWGALEALQRSLQMDPECQEARQHMKTALDFLFAEMDKLRQEKKYAQAFLQAEKLVKTLPRNTEARRQQEEIRLDWAKQLLAEAQEMMGRKLFGNALVKLVKISGLVGVWGDSAEIEQQARSRLLSDSRFCARLAGGKVKATQKSRQESFLDALSQKKPAGCANWSGYSNACGKISLQATLVEAGISDSRQAETGEQKYQSGKRKVDNPKFLETKAKIEEKRTRLSELAETIKQDERVVDECRQAFADAGPSDDEDSLRERLKQAEAALNDHQKEQRQTEEELRDLRNELSRLPPKLDEPVYDIFRYEVNKVTRTATVKIELVASGEKRQRLREETVEGTASASDTSHPAHKRYGVEADPLKLPKSNEQLLQEALDSAAEKASRLLGEICQGWRNELVARARQAAEDSPLDATEDFVLYLLVDPAPPAKDIVDFFRRQHELASPAALRGEGAAEPHIETSPPPGESPAEEESSGLEI